MKPLILVIKKRLNQLVYDSSESLRKTWKDYQTAWYCLWVEGQTYVKDLLLSILLNISLKKSKHEDSETQSFDAESLFDGDDSETPRNLMRELAHLQ